MKKKMTTKMMKTITKELKNKERKNARIVRRDPIKKYVEDSMRLLIHKDLGKQRGKMSW